MLSFSSFSLVRRCSTLAIAAVGFVALSCAPVYSSNTNTKNSQETYRQLNLFGDVFERVRADYVEEVSDKELMEAAINGMLTHLDPHSGYMNMDSFRDMQVQTKGEFGGLGIEVTMENGLVKVVSPIDETPAARAGLQPGDFISHLDGEPVLGITLNEAVEKMRGPINTSITLTIRRNDVDPFDVIITRDVIKIRAVRWNREGNIGYIRISSFNEQTQTNLEKAIAELQKEIGKDLQGFILDMRNNPGGLLEQAVSVSDSFLKQGEIVSTRTRNVEETQRYNANNGDLAKELPIVVLINGGSASASEIVAGALQDHRRAIVLGTPSFGKGSVQTIIPLPGHGAMRLTTARYYTPSGRSIQAKGIEPDIIVPVARIEKMDTSFLQRESDLRGALDVRREQQKTPPAPAAKPENDEEAEKEEGITDYQLSRAIDLLNGISLYQQKTAAE